MGLVVWREVHLHWLMPPVLANLPVTRSASMLVKRYFRKAHTSGWSGPSCMSRKVRLLSFSKPCIVISLWSLTFCFCACRRFRTFLRVTGALIPSNRGRRSWRNCSSLSFASLIFRHNGASGFAKEVEGRLSGKYNRPEERSIFVVEHSAVPAMEQSDHALNQYARRLSGIVCMSVNTLSRGSVGVLVSSPHV
jgi:hypothetical protein